MRLYYYTAKQWGLKSLWEQRLKVGWYEDLNDPFELLPFNQTNRQERSQISQIVGTLAKNHGVICFSETWTTALMWAHYGDKHKGICLGCDIDSSDLLTKIEYTNERLPSPLDRDKPNWGIDEKMIGACLKYKHSGWAYEREHRLRARLDEERDGIYFLPFNSQVKLREVIIGARCTLTAVEIAETFRGKPDYDVRIRTARAAHGNFRMCVDRTAANVVVPGVSGSSITGAMK
jgi:hypothetical protein